MWNLTLPTTHFRFILICICPHFILIRHHHCCWSLVATGHWPGQARDTNQGKARSTAPADVRRLVMQHQVPVCGRPPVKAPAWARLGAGHRSTPVHVWLRAAAGHSLGAGSQGAAWLHRSQTDMWRHPAWLRARACSALGILACVLRRSTMESTDLLSLFFSISST